MKNLNKTKKMVTLKGKQADKFIKKMIKKETSPISKKDKKLAREIKENMSKLIESDAKRRKEIEDKYNPTIPKSKPGFCERCKINKATMDYTDSIMSFAHGMIERICQECYDKMKRENPWYKEGYENGRIACLRDAFESDYKEEEKQNPWFDEGYKKGWNDCLKALG